MRLIDSDAIISKINACEIDNSTIEVINRAIRDCGDGLDCSSIPIESYLSGTVTVAPKINCHEDYSPRPTNCSNCGAPLHGGRCEYCGTEY